MKYTADTKIGFVVSTGIMGSKHSETHTIEKWTGLTPEEISDLDEKDIYQALDERWAEWRDEVVEGGWGTVE